MKNNRILLILSLISISLAIGSVFIVFNKSNKVGYVIIQEIYNEFEMKKEMEGKYTTIKNTRKKILDSLQIDISILAKKIEFGKADETDRNNFEHKKVEFNKKMRMFEEDNSNLSQELDAQIIKQLNQYVTDYGKEKGYDIILGSTTDGSIMFGTDRFNCTNEVVSYINNKYKGIK